MKFQMPKSMSGNRWNKTKPGGMGPEKRSSYMQKPGKSMYPKGRGKAVSGYKFKGSA